MRPKKKKCSICYFPSFLWVNTWISCHWGQKWSHLWFFLFIVFLSLLLTPAPVKCSSLSRLLKISLWFFQVVCFFHSDSPRLFQMALTLHLFTPALIWYPLNEKEGIRSPQTSMYCTGIFCDRPTCIFILHTGKWKQRHAFAPFYSNAYMQSML